jgi:HlyD family secretion protein
MRNRIVFALAALGLLAGATSAYLHGRKPQTPPPAFAPAANPYPKGIYANGIVESLQPSGVNVNVFPEVPGSVVRVLVAEGQDVEKGAPLLAIEDSVQRGVVEQQAAQLAAAQALLAELKAQPRPESLEIAKAQAAAARASLKTSQDARDKQRRSFQIEPRSVSKDTLDGAENAVKVAEANVEVAERQLRLVEAGAWVYDVRNQEAQCTALSKALASSTALLGKFTIRAPVTG